MIISLLVLTACGTAQDFTTGANDKVKIIDKAKQNKLTETTCADKSMECYIDNTGTPVYMSNKDFKTKCICDKATGCNIQECLI